MSFEKVVIGPATLYRGDSLELLAAGVLKCDAIVSDPPYGISYKHGGGRVNGVGVRQGGVPLQAKTDTIHGDDRPFDPAIWIDAAPCRSQKEANGGEPRIILWGADHFRHRIPEGGTMLAWDKHLGRGPDDSFADCEWAWCGPKVRREIFRWLWKGVVTNKHKLDRSPHQKAFARVHVSQKPVELMRWSIEKLKVPVGGIVLDPYLGSGTTGIAALSLGMKFVGVEIDQGHFETACARIREAVDTF